jgi:predicted PurR-regulated permease PerM
MAWREHSEDWEARENWEDWEDMDGEFGSNRPPIPKTDGVYEFRQKALAVGFGLFALGVLVLLLAIYLQLAYPILWATCLAVLFYPLHVRILRVVGRRSSVAATVSTVLALAIIFIPSVFAVVHLIREVQNLWPDIRDSLGPTAFERVARWIEASRFSGVAHFVLGEGTGSGAAVLQERLQELSLTVQEFLLDRLRSVTRSAPAAILQLGITVLAFFFFLKQGPLWSKQIQSALPIADAHAHRLFKIVGQTINAVFRGVLLTALTQAILAGLGFWAAGAPVPLLLSMVTFVCALIPFVGPVVVWLPTTIGLFLAGKVGAAVGLFLWGTLVVSLVDNFLRPYLIGREMRLPVLWLFLAILGGLKLFGFLGVVVGPATLSLAFAFIRIYKEGRGPGDIVVPGTPETPESSLTIPVSPAPGTAPRRERA